MQNSFTEMSGGDPDSNRLLAKVIGKMDGVLVNHGLEFNDDANFADFTDRLAALIFEFYDDLTGGASDYEPSDPTSGAVSDGTEPSDSVSLNSEDDDCEEDSAEEDADYSPPKKSKR